MLLPLITTLVTPLYLLSLAAAAVASSVSVVLPISQQLPLIARVGQPYSWQISAITFSSYLNDTLTYTVSTLPGWLTFDPGTRNFHGTPSDSDKNDIKITVTATDSANASASSQFTLPVTSDSQPQLSIPIAGQFYPNNPSLSSVFMIEKTSALYTPNPALRIPPQWSFSIGFQGDTVTSSDGVHYEVLQADGSALPSWMTFSPSEITLNGVTPHADTIPSTVTLSLALHASDQEDYTAVSLPFDIVVASHELTSSNMSLPTINITASTEFFVSLMTTADFSGIFVDGQPLQPANVTALNIDTSQYHWLKYDASTMSLSGQPPDDLKATKGGPNPLVPVSITVNFNQTLNTNISLAVVPSYFTESNFNDIVVDPGQEVRFSLVPDLSNSTVLSSQQSDINLYVAYDPGEASQFLSFDPGSDLLSGTVPPADQLDFNHVTITFTAYSRLTHSTSHASLAMAFSASRIGPGNVKHGHPTSLSVKARRRLVLGLGVSFGTIGGLIVIGGFLALFRCCTRIEDSALGGEEGLRALSAEEKTWYGIGAEVNKIARSIVTGREGNEWEKYAVASETSEGGSMEEILPAVQESGAATSRYGALGLGLHPSVPRTQSYLPPSRGVMKKGEFVVKIKETARQVSDKFRQVSDKYTRLNARRLRPIIGNPMPLPPGNIPISRVPFDERRVAYQPSPFFMGNSASMGTSIIDSPTSSSGGRSIPHRKADFTPKPAHLRTHRSSGGSLSTHAGEATIHTASRATSINSGKRSSYQSQSDGHPGFKRPRVVQFTSSSRVPVPKVPSDAILRHGAPATDQTSRVASQIALVYNPDEHKRQGSMDGLNLGMHYVNTLGEKMEDATISSSNSSTPKVGQGKENVPLKRVVKAGEKFSIEVKLATKSSDYGKLEARLASGESVPTFLHLEFMGYGDASKRAVEFYGVPVRANIGEYTVEVFEEGNRKRVAKLVIQVVDKTNK